MEGGGFVLVENTGSERGEKFCGFAWLNECEGQRNIDGMERHGIEAKMLRVMRSTPLRPRSWSIV